MEVARQAPAWAFTVLVSRREPALELPNIRQIVIPSLWRPLERALVVCVMNGLALTGRVDVVHFARTMGGRVRRVPSLLTVFALTTVVHPELYSRSARWYWRYAMPGQFRAASRLIAISHDVARGLVEHFGVPEGKIAVVYCAPQSALDRRAPDVEIETVRARYSLPDTYLLYLGLLARKKNLATLLYAVQRLQHDGVPVTLVLAGRRYDRSDDSPVLDLVRELGIDGSVRYLGEAPEGELRGLVSGARAFCFPSLHEGFGIPCLEAMRCQVPVIAARSPAVSEVLGDAAHWVEDPLDVTAFAEAIALVLADGGYAASLVRRGIERSARFTWSGSAQQLLRLYADLARGTRPSGGA
jgi:glycosyltransferase involved in cell wall biosynthesis